MSYNKLIEFENRFINCCFITDGRTTFECVNKTSLDYHDRSYSIPKGITISNYMKHFDDVCSTFNINPLCCLYQLEKLAKKIIHIGLSKQKECNLQVLDEFELKHSLKYNSGFIYANTKIRTSATTTSYDRNSSYAVALKSSVLQWTTKQGKYIKIDKMPDNLYSTLAYYLVKIDLNSRLPINFRNFKTQDGHLIEWLTNYEILTLNLYSTTYELVNANDYNCYAYENEKINYRSMHETNIMKLYKMKMGGNLVAKNILKMLHGVLFKQFGKEYHERTTKARQIKTGEYILNKDGDEIEVFKNEGHEQYLYNHLRNCRFYYAFGRLSMNKDIAEIENAGFNVYRSYFDSIVCDKNDYMDKRIGDAMGQCKYEVKEWNNTIGIFINCKSWKQINE